jgi:hypothetical protein
MPYTKPERNNRYGGSEDEDNKEKDEEPKIFGADPPSNVDLGFAMHLVFPKADE